MPAGDRRDPGSHNQIVRRVKVARGSVELEVMCEPAFDYARATPRVALVPRRRRVSRARS